jgi:hypothetical protein
VSSSQGGLDSLPTAWSNGSQWATCPVSAFVGGTAGAVAATTTPTTPTGTTVILTTTGPSATTAPTTSTTGTTTSQLPSLPIPPLDLGAPQISDTTTQGHRLTTTNGTWTGSPTSFVYEWQDCNSTGGSCSSISGATSASYILTANDVGDTIRVVVTATNSGGSTPATSTATATATATSSGGGTSNTNCLGTIGSGQVNYSSLDGCGYPSPNTTGVPAGTTLTAVSSISCTNKTIDAESTSGSVTIGSNCTITDSRLTGGQITVQSGITNVTLSHDEISGPYTGSPTSPSCSYSSSSGTTSDVLAEGAASAVTLDYDYLHCAAEPLNGNMIVSNSYIIADECWGPCGSNSTTHNEAIYVAGGGSGGTDIEHNTILNEYAQTAGIFGDDHAYGPIHNLTIDNNLVAAGGDNGAIATGDSGDGNTNVKLTNNRLAYVYSSSMPTGGSSAATWSGNYRDDNLATVGVSN